MLDLTGVTHTYRFALAGDLQVTGARGLRQTVTAATATVKVNSKGKAFSVIVSGRTLAGGAHANAIFYPADFTDDHPTALSLSIAAEREFALMIQRSCPADHLPGWPDPDARPTY